MSDIPRDPIGAADSYHANITINAPIDTVFAAVSPVAGLSGCWTTDTGGSRPADHVAEQHVDSSWLCYQATADDPDVFLPTPKARSGASIRALPAGITNRVGCFLPDFARG